MPTAVGGFIAKVGVFVVDALIAVGFSQGTAIAILDFGIKLAALAGLNKLSESLIGVDDVARSAESFNQTIRSTVEHQRIIYGETIASGPLWYINTSGDNNEILWQGIMLAGHEIEDITDVWLDDVEIPSGYIDWAGTGDVTSGDFRGNTGESPSTLR